MDIQKNTDEQIISPKSIVFQVWISIVFINLMAQAINNTQNFLSGSIPIKPLESISHGDLYFNIYTNGMTLLLAMFMIRITSYGFIDTTRIIFILFLEVYDTILHYAIRYYEYGLLSNGKITHNYIDSIYFSIVTWTTVGYGDLIPPQSLKSFVASEAMVGQFLQSICIAAIVGILNPWLNLMRGGEKGSGSQKVAEPAWSMRSRYLARPSKSWRKITTASRARRKRMSRK